MKDTETRQRGTGFGKKLDDGQSLASFLAIAVADSRHRRITSLSRLGTKACARHFITIKYEQPSFNKGTRRLA